MKYRLKGTKSGRLSSGNGSKSDKKRNTYYIDLNAQNLTKPASAYYSAEKCDLNDPEGILGWKFTPLETDYAMEHLEDLYIVEGQDPGITIRGCLKAPEGRYVVSLDYDAEEYRLMAVLSRDSLMLSNFYNGIDPHTASAYAIWGEENYNKAKRKKAKIFNFLNNYSGGAYTLSQALDIPQSEAQDMINAYNAKFHEMVAWKEKEIYEMYQNNGVVFTAFGRPRQFKGWLNAIEANRNSYDNLIEKEQVEKASLRVKSAIERRVASHLIQGTAGDILRLVLLNLYKRYFRNRDPHIDFLSTVHDEVNYTIDKEYTVDYVRELEEIMTFDKLDKTLPIQTSTDIGFTYGNMFPFVWEDETTKKVLIPKRVHHA
jgi:DNA polymerase I-like protein with 3'-5' exonuclease and polymerase domains